MENRRGRETSLKGKEKPNKKVEKSLKFQKNQSKLPQGLSIPSGRIQMKISATAIIVESSKNTILKAFSVH
jgi:hypothetical protein